MTPTDFIAWQNAMGISFEQAGELLGTGKRTVTRYRTVGVNRAIDLACAWLSTMDDAARALVEQANGDRDVLNTAIGNWLAEHPHADPATFRWLIAHRNKT
jgi:hypothetical protein